MSTVQPNMAIVRFPDEDGEPMFLELKIENGIMADHGRKFTVKEGDTYRELKRSQVALVNYDEG